MLLKIPKRKPYNYFIILVLLILSYSAQAKEGTKVTRTVTKAFAAKSNVSFDVNNKYGQVIINTWKKDSLKIVISITAYGKNEEAVEKIMERIDFDFDNSEEFIKAETVLDRQSSVMREFWNTITDYSKTILSKNNIKINYMIYAPEDTKLTLHNKFGDVYIDHIEGKSKIFVSYGNLKADKIAQNSITEVRFGSAYLKFIKGGNLVLNAAEVDINRAENLKIESGSSKIVISSIDQLYLDSHNDKVQIEKVARLSGKGSFTKCTVEEVSDQLDLTMSYGEINVLKVYKSFTSVDISGSATDMDIRFESNSYITADIKAREGNLFYPKATADVEKKYTDEKQKFIALTGQLGIKNDNPGSLKLNAQNGDVRLSFN